MDANEPAPSPALIVHLRHDDANDLPWDIVHSRSAGGWVKSRRTVPKLSYGAVRQVEPERLESCSMPTRPSCSQRVVRAIKDFYPNTSTS